MKFVWVAALLASLTGCALTEDTPEIKYTVGTVAPVPNAQPVALNVVDARTADRNRISTKINGMGMEMAAIRSAQEVQTVVRDALVAEFKARGFAVEAGGSPVTVSIDRFYNQFHVGLVGKADGEATLTVSVADRRGNKLYSGSFTGTSEAPILLANGSNAAQSVAAALKDAVTKMFADPQFINAVTRPAAAGAPSA